MWFLDSLVPHVRGRACCWCILSNTPEDLPCQCTLTLGAVQKPRCVAASGPTRRMPILGAVCGHSDASSNRVTPCVRRNKPFQLVESPGYSLPRSFL